MLRMKLKKGQQSVQLSPEEESAALLYLGATQLYPKDVRDKGDLRTEKELLGKITPADIMRELGGLENPLEKMTLIREADGMETIRQWARMWMETHPKDYEGLK